MKPDWLLFLPMAFVVFLFGVFIGMHAKEPETHRMENNRIVNITSGTLLIDRDRNIIIIRGKNGQD